MQTPDVNDPAGYYAGSHEPSLFWEMTICQCLSRLESPYQAALERPARYGEILARFLTGRVGLDPAWSVLEVGGGYGSLMAALLDAVPVRDVTMVDISPFFTGEQRRRLGDRPGRRFVTADALQYLEALEGEVDLAISNENIGDLPTVTGIRKDALSRAAEHGSEGPLGEVARLVARYDLDLTDAPELFHFNLGAVRYLEELAPKARVVFLAEHGADTLLPAAYDFLPLIPGDGHPRRIRLKGHDEYTVRFGHLERVARALGWQVDRFHMAELLGLRRDDGIRSMARTNTTASEVAEAVHEFCAHVAEYQCMLLTR